MILYCSCNHFVLVRSCRDYIVLSVPNLKTADHQYRWVEPKPQSTMYTKLVKLRSKLRTHNKWKGNFSSKCLLTCNADGSLSTFNFHATQKVLNFTSTREMIIPLADWPSEINKLIWKKFVHPNLWCADRRNKCESCLIPSLDQKNRLLWIWCYRVADDPKLIVSRYKGLHFDVLSSKFSPRFLFFLVFFVLQCPFGWE